MCALQKGRLQWGSWLPVALLSAVVLSVLAFSVLRGHSQTPEIFVHIRGEHGMHDVSIWEKENGDFYFFLPAGYELSDATLLVRTSARVYLDGKPMEEGDSLAHLSLGQRHSLTVGRRTRGLYVLRAENVATLFVDTASGTMKAVHADKNRREECGIMLLDAQGDLNFVGGGCTVKGRGNSTWNYDKRPYLLSFDVPADLLGMGAANKWVLLANATDESNLRNKLVYDLAGRVGLPWAPQCEYVELYLNGVYNGLYLLAERVEIGESRLDIGADPESFLCKLDLNERFSQLSNPFLTNLGRAVEISAPEGISKSRVREIAGKVQEMEDAILTGDPEGILDLDSWVLRLLIDEVTENLDADRASSYFYYTNGKFYAGPVWDYDHIWGTRDTNLNPEALLAKTGYKAPEKQTPYSSALYRNPVIYKRMVELYETRLLPELRRMADSEILETERRIAEAAAMNSIRWESMYEYWNFVRSDAADMAAFLRTRLEFLNGVWLEGEEYYTVQVDTGAEYNYMNFVVRPGEPFTRLGEVTAYANPNPVWVDSETGQEYCGQPITRDTRLNLKVDVGDELQHHNDVGITNAYLNLLVVMTVTAGVCCRRGLRRKKHER